MSVSQASCLLYTRPSLEKKATRTPRREAVKLQPLDDMMLVGGRQVQGEELLAAQLRELLFSPTTPPPPCDGSNKRSGRDDDEPAATARRHSCKTRMRRTNKQQQQKKSSSRCLVTTVPDFDGYQWRKYGQKQIEGAIYARSYYRCVRSAEQGCPAKRTVQRNDDDGDGAPAEYKVVYMGDHTCTAKLEAPPVILETAAATVPAADNNTTTAKQMRSSYDDDDATSTTSTSSADQSPAISDITWSSNDHDSWQDFISGPILSPVHVPAAADTAWTIDHYFLIDDMMHCI